MIQEIKIKNFRSFKDEVTFSFEASNDKFAEDSQVVQMRIPDYFALPLYMAIMRRENQTCLMFLSSCMTFGFTSQRIWT